MTTYLCLIPSFLMGLLFAHLASRVIDGLYSRRAEHLTFSEEVAARSKRRPIYLTVGATLIFYFASILTIGVPSFLLHVLPSLLLLLVVITDSEQHLIFDEVNGTLVILGLLSYALSCLGMEGIVPAGVLDAPLPAALVAGLSFAVLAILTRGGIGGGDVKLLFALGLLLGADRTMACVFVGAIAGGLGALLHLLRHHDKRALIAYGPYYAIPAILLLLLP